MLTMFYPRATFLSVFVETIATSHPGLTIAANTRPLTVAMATSSNEDRAKEPNQYHRRNQRRQDFADQQLPGLDRRGKQRLERPVGFIKPNTSR
jgi:hypothetical protein